MSEILAAGQFGRSYTKRRKIPSLRAESVFAPDFPFFKQDTPNEPPSLEVSTVGCALELLETSDEYVIRLKMLTLPEQINSRTGVKIGNVVYTHQRLFTLYDINGAEIAHLETLKTKDLAAIPITTVRKFVFVQGNITTTLPFIQFNTVQIVDIKAKDGIFSVTVDEDSAKTTNLQPLEGVLKEIVFGDDVNDNVDFANYFFTIVSRNDVTGYTVDTVFPAQFSEIHNGFYTPSFFPNAAPLLTGVSYNEMEEGYRGEQGYTYDSIIGQEPIKAAFFEFTGWHGSDNKVEVVERRVETDVNVQEVVMGERLEHYKVRLTTDINGKTEYGLRIS
jgi:hypothetical protein